MHWIAASLVSALFLGVYELCTKHAVRDKRRRAGVVLQHPDRRGGVGWLVDVQLLHPGTLPATLVTDRSH